jgi:exodeoxyribonuclease VII large subunit
VSQQRDLFDTGEQDPQQQPVYSVSQITHELRRTITERFDDIVVEGELSNTKRHSSGHWYLTLKDESAQLGAVMFRREAATVRFVPEDGMRVRATGKLDLYARQGRYQLMIRHLEPVGQGSLELAFRQLCKKLEAEGLFEAARKQALPRFPQHIALITSPTGAAVHDMLTTLQRRWPLAPVSVVPVHVQGELAPREIVAALEFLNRHHTVDVIVVGRGGGSLEDLWAFNDEQVARAIAASEIPVVSGVGHEVDTTIADLVADQRAATPTAAAALLVPDQHDVKVWVQDARQRMAVALRKRSELERLRLQAVQRSYGLRRPQLLIAECRQRLDDAVASLHAAHQSALELQKHKWTALVAQLRALSPRGILQRGYTYCVDSSTGKVVPRASETTVAQDLLLHFADGMVPTQVTAKLPPSQRSAKGKK